ncbi:MAG: acyl-CoA thioesterase [Comamonas sp.]|nr:acyl-CoA thioesterase [Comamonas sp.]
MAQALARLDYETSYSIRFSHCDPAGIIFYPQYAVLFNHLVEDWFTHGLGIDYAQMIGQRRVGLPIVRLETDFRAISRMGEQVQFGLQVERLGGKSLSLAVQARLGDEVRAQGRKVLVFTDLERHTAINIPADIRQAIEAAAQALA